MYWAIFLFALDTHNPLPPLPAAFRYATEESCKAEAPGMIAPDVGYAVCLAVADAAP